MPETAFIVGGTGQIGRAIAARLLADGWQVTLSSRGEREGPQDLVAAGARMVVLDRDEPSALAAALRGGADAVIDTVAYDERHADQLLELEGNVGRFVVVSSASVYRDDQGRTLDEAGENGFPELPEPITEAQPTVDPGPDTYSTRKVALERRLLDRATRPVTVLRPCAIQGSYSVHPREWWFVKRILDGRRVIPLAFDGESRFHTTAVANIAALTAIALRQTQNQVLNIADPVALNVREIGETIAGILGWDGEFRPLDVGDREKGGAPVGWSPWSVPKPFVVSTEAAERIGYYPVAGYAGEAERTCRWLAAQQRDGWEARFPICAAYSIPLFDYQTEDAFLAKVGLR